MITLLRIFAAVAASALTIGLTSSCAFAGSPASADPTGPTLESIAPPAPVPAQVPVQSNPAPAASNTTADEAAARQVVQTYYEAYRAEDWDTLLSQVCPASQYRITDEFRDMRARLGPGAPLTINAVTVTGDTAKVTAGGMIVTVKRGANGWQICQD